MALKVEQRFLDTIPEFSGDARELAYFLKTAEALCNKFYNLSDPNSYENFVLIANIRNKIKGEAKSAISAYSINSWSELKNALIASYSDKRDCYTLAIEMTNLKQQPDENAFVYHNKMITLLNAHSSYIETHVDAAYKSALVTYGQTLAVRSFLRGLQNPLKSLLQTRNPNCLSSALKIITNDFQYEASRSMSTRDRNKQLNQKVPYVKENKNFNQNFIPSFKMPIPQSIQRNVNKYEQTPMSISENLPTYSQNKQRTYQQKPYKFVPQSKPTFKSKELYNVSEEQSSENENEQTENVDSDDEQQYFLEETIDHDSVT